MPTKITPKQLAANRANALRSTGPRTPEGKAVSSRNARKHGFASSDFPVPVLEGYDDVTDLRADLIEVYKPVNSQELYAIERIAIAQHHLLRAARLESGLFTACLNQASDNEPIHLLNPGFGDPNLKMTRGQKQNFALAEGFHNLAASSQTWKLFLRYQAQNERLYRRAVEEFERLKSLRAEFAKTPDEPVFNPQPKHPEPGSAPPIEPIPAVAPTPPASDAPGLGAAGPSDLPPSVPGPRRKAPATPPAACGPHAPSGAHLHRQLLFSDPPAPAPSPAGVWPASAVPHPRPPATSFVRYLPVR